MAIVSDADLLILGPNCIGDLCCKTILRMHYNRDALQKAEIVRAIEITDYQGTLVGFEE